MPLPLPGINVQVDYVGTHDVKILPAAATLEMLYCKLARSLVSFSECGRAMREIVLAVLCGGQWAFFAMVGDFLVTVPAIICRMSNRLSADEREIALLDE